LTEGAAREEVLEILGWYEKIYTELLAVPVVKGQKTDKVKFFADSRILVPIY
jgi:prolyl-tRNA synthetase